MISRARQAGMVTKSNLILGMGETHEEILDAMHALHESGCDILTITQYLRPSAMHHPIDRWVKPEEFVELSEAAREIGFHGVMAGPLVRSSYRAGRLYARALASRGEELPENLSELAAGGEETALQEASALLHRHGASRDTAVSAFRRRRVTADRADSATATA